MPSIRDLKKDINHVLGDIIERIYVWELENSKGDLKKSEALIDETIQTFDELIVKVSDRAVESRSDHLKSVSRELEDRGQKLIDKLSKL
ncbi:MAG: hypothetical protein HKO90_08800 [Flavobacteriaceae bacterium]|nr:hypothetical protein [Flavobacteriaceae bacterium]